MILARGPGTAGLRIGFSTRRDGRGSGENGTVVENKAEKHLLVAAEKHTDEERHGANAWLRRRAARGGAKGMFVDVNVKAPGRDVTLRILRFYA